MIGMWNRGSTNKKLEFSTWNRESTEWNLESNAVLDSLTWGYIIGGSRGGAGGPPPLFLDQTETRRAEKRVLETSFPPPPPSYLKVWIRQGSGTVYVPEQRLVVIFNLFL